MDIFTCQSLATHLFGLDPEHTIAYSAVVFFYFLFSISMASSPVIQTSFGGMIAAFFSFIALILILPVWIAFPILCLVALAILTPVVLSLNYNAKARRERTKAIKTLPLATTSDIDEVVKLIMTDGANAHDFRMHDDGRVVYGEDETPRYVTKSNPLKYVNRPYVYAEQATDIRSRYPQLLLGKDDRHALCAHLYFNWAIEALSIDDQATIVTLTRRGETKTLNFVPVCHDTATDISTGMNVETL
jgi:hypothetical protein